MKKLNTIAITAVTLCLLVVGVEARAVLINIMPLGNSITRGDPAITPGAYRTSLWSLLQAGGYDVDFVGTQQQGPTELPDQDHEGHSGYRIRQIIEGFDEDGVDGIEDWLDQLVIAGDIPDIVLLMIGTNNILQGQVYRNSAPTDLADLIDLLAAELPGARIITSTITPLTFSDPIWDQRVQQFNALIPGIVAQKVSEGKNVSFADIYSALDPVVDISDDHAHPTASGYNKAAQVWYDAIVPEPTSLALLSAGVLASLFYRRSQDYPRYTP